METNKKLKSFQKGLVNSFQSLNKINDYQHTLYNIGNKRKDATGDATRFLKNHLKTLWGYSVPARCQMKIIGKIQEMNPEGRSSLQEVEAKNK